MGVAVYVAGITLPKECPPEISLDLASGFHCLVERNDSSIQLTLTAPALPDEWPGDDAPFAVADGEAQRVAASLCFDYAVPFRSPTRERPRNPNRTGPISYDLRLVTFESAWPEESVRLVDLLGRDDPRTYPLWQTLTSVGALSDPLAQFVVLWGLLDIGLEAKKAQDVDEYLFNRFKVVRDRPDRHGNPNRETKFTSLRHRISHPSGRSVDDLGQLASEAQSLVKELTGYCRAAVRESFAAP